MATPIKTLLSLIRPFSPSLFSRLHAHQLTNIKIDKKIRDAFQLQGIREGGGDGII